MLHNIKQTITILFLLLSAFLISSCAEKPEDRTDRVNELYDEHESIVKDADCGRYCIGDVCSDLGECETGWLCGDDNHCYDPCDGLDCGISEGVECGTCSGVNLYCSDANKCEKTLVEMVFVPAATTAKENGDITVDHDFYIGKYEITFDQYEQFATADDEGWGKGSRPVINVSWYDVVKYANWLSEQTGLEKVYAEICYTDVSSCTMDVTKKGYRLPTKTEWEYAARGGKDGKATIYSGSDTIGDVAWYMDNSGKKTHPVGAQESNELGIYDMSGNVEEWTFEHFEELRYAVGGGNWDREPMFCQVDSFGGENVSYHSIYIGFRLVRTK